MKAHFYYFVVFVLAICSCQRDKITATDYINETTVHSDDQSRFSGEIDAVSNDINLAIETSAAFAGRNGNTMSVFCDADVILDTLSNPRTLTITYNGTNCLGNRIRTGSIVISMNGGVRWRNAGAAIQVSFRNLKVTRLSDNKQMTLNGEQVHTNVSGGLLVQLSTLGSIVHTVSSSNMAITFDDGTQRTWQVARRRTFTFNRGIVIATKGTHQQGGVINIAEWGNNRFGTAFTTRTVQDLVIRQDCDFRLVSGKLAQVTTLVNAEATFGLDASGNPTPCPGSGNFYVKIAWTGPTGTNRSIILPY